MLLTQWGKKLGAIVIGIVGSVEKAALAKKNGCKHVLVRGRDEIAAQVKKLTKGLGAHVVYDGVGKDTFFESLDCLRRRGLMVSYGNASGPVAPFAPAELVKRGSLYVTRPDDVRLHGDARGSRSDCARDLRRGEEEVDQGPDPPALQARRCRAGASRSREPQDDGRDGHSPGLIYGGVTFGGLRFFSKIRRSASSRISSMGTRDALLVHAIEIFFSGK